jgi:hypothetical protein
MTPGSEAGFRNPASEPGVVLAQDLPSRGRCLDVSTETANSTSMSSIGL